MACALHHSHGLSVKPGKMDELKAQLDDAWSKKQMAEEAMHGGCMVNYARVGTGDVCTERMYGAHAVALMG